MYHYTLGTSYVESSSAQENLVVWSYTKPNMTQQLVLMAEKTRTLQGCSRQKIANRTREVIAPLYWTLVRPIRNAGSSTGLSAARKILIKWRKTREGLQNY